MRRFDGILFDKDGTLFDFSATWVGWARSLMDRLCDGDTARAAAMGARIGFDYHAGRFAPDSVVIAETAGEIAEILAPELPGQSVVAVLDLINAEAALAEQVPAVPLVPFFEDLRRRGYRLGIATNDAEMPARAHLAQAGVSEMFDFIAGYDSGYGGKPAPGQLEAFTAQNGMSCDRCVMVGDSAHDLHAGRAAGMACVGVLTGIAQTADLEPFADIVLPDIGHLPHWLDGMG